MYEVEVKVKASHGPVRSRLAESDATHTDTVEQTDTYYDAPHREFETTDEALRIRTERTPDAETTMLLTYKGPRVDDASKTRTEIETGVTSHIRMNEILESLGFSPVATVEKTRERYAIGEYTVALDAVTGLGAFVEVETEIEAPDPERADAIETAREGALSILRDLGLDPDDQIRTAYLGLLLNNQE